MDVTQYLHPLMQRGMTKDPNSVYNALINALNSPLNNAESDILRSKTNIMLAQAPEDWLDTFGSWLGLKRKDKEPDNVYRKRLMDWVLTDKNDVSSIRNAIANFLNISSDCVYVYEPYTDMLYYNKLGSDYNSLKYFASSYYNYCVIDVQIDSTFPIREVQDIINLFRPAGVIYVLTMSINSFNHNAPIIDMSEDGSTPMFYDETYYAGFNQRVQGLITPSLSDDVVVTNPFFYSENLSLFNDGKEYQNQDSQFNDYMTLGEYYKDYTPNDSDTFTSGRVYSKNYSLQDNMLLSKSDNKYLKYNINKFDSDYNNINTSINVSNYNYLRNSLTCTDYSYWYTPLNILNNSSGTYMGCSIVSVSADWNNVRYAYNALLKDGVAYDTKNIYTFSALIRRHEGAKGKIDYFSNGISVIEDHTNDFDNNNMDWQQIYITFKFKDPSDVVHTDDQNYYNSLRFELSGCQGTTTDFTMFKLEKGDKPTKFSINPKDLGINDLTSSTFIGSNHLTTAVGNFNISLPFDINSKYILIFDSDLFNIKLKAFGLDIDNLGNQTYLISNCYSSNAYCSIYSVTTSLIKNFSIYKLNDGSKTTTTYNYNTYPNKSLGISGVANVLGALQMHFSLPSNINANNLLTNYYTDSYLTIKLRADIPIKSNHNIDIYIYDFSANIWSLYRTINISDNSYINQNIRINDYSNILNSKGCIFYKIVTDIDLDVDYFGLSFNSYNYNEPKLNSYFNSSKLVLKNTFTDGRLGDWEMKTVVNDNTCPIESLKDVASESLNNSTVFYNLRRCVIPGTIYKIDAEIYSTSGVTFGVSKNNDSIYDGGTTISTSDGGWQHISGYIQIKNGIFSIYPYFMINSNDGILKISYINAEIADKNTIENNMIISSNNGYNNMMYTLSS